MEYNGFELKKIEGFTPGPWIIDGDFIIGALDVSPDLYDGSGGDIVCDFDPDTEYDQPKPEQRKSNASLIAYAPEMYAMLQSLSAQSEGERWVSVEEYKNIAIKALEDKPVIKMLMGQNIPFEKWAANIQKMVDEAMGAVREVRVKLPDPPTIK